MIDAGEGFLLLEKCCITVLLSSVFLRYHDMRQLVCAEKATLCCLVVSIALRNWYGVVAPK